MTTQATQAGSAGGATSALDRYTAAFEDQALLGYIVWYSIFESPVTPEDMERWFRELDLDLSLVPGKLRAEDAFEKVTGPSGVRVSYPLDDPTGTAEPGAPRERDGQKAELMIRFVSRDDRALVKHIVREVRDPDAKALKYDSRLAVCRFHRDMGAGAAAGGGTIEVVADEDEIADLPEAEQGVIRRMLFDIEDLYRRRCTYLSSDRLRAVLRTYIESLNGVKVRPTGGVYFVHGQHAEVLAKLRTLVSRFGGRSHLVRIPLPDEDEMRQVVVEAVTIKTKEDLQALAKDIAAVRRMEDPKKAAQKAADVQARFKALKAANAEHEQLLSTSLEDTREAWELVNLQLASLLMKPGDE